MSDKAPLTLSLQLARQVAGLDLALIPEQVRQRAAYLMLDGIGAACAAQRRKIAGRLEQAFDAWDGKESGRHAVIASPRLRRARDAAFLNGQLIHGLEFDDVHMAAVLHPTCVLFPAALATAEWADAPGHRLLLAYIAGVEVAARLGMVSTGGFQRRGFHPTGVVGTLAAAVAAGCLLELDEAAMVSAQGLALSMASGSMQFLEDGGDTKRLHAGWAAQAGMQASMLARQGLCGPQRAYEGRHGMLATHVDQPADLESVHRTVATIGTHWELENIAVKPFPAAYYAHACIEAAMELALYDNLDTANITAIVAWVPEQVMPKIAEPLQAKRRPQTAGQAQFSLPFLVAAGLLRRRFTLDELEAGVLHDPQVLAMADRVTCRGEVDTAFPAVYPGRLEIRLANGHTLSKSIDVNLGAQARPVANSFILDKFRQNVPSQQGRGVVDRVIGIEDFRSVREFGRLLAAMPVE